MLSPSLIFTGWIAPADPIVALRRQTEQLPGDDVERSIPTFVPPAVWVVDSSGPYRWRRQMAPLETPLAPSASVATPFPDGWFSVTPELIRKAKPIDWSALALVAALQTPVFYIEQLMPLRARRTRADWADPAAPPAAIFAVPEAPDALIARKGRPQSWLETIITPVLPQGWAALYPDLMRRRQPQAEQPITIVVKTDIVVGWAVDAPAFNRRRGDLSQTTTVTTATAAAGGQAIEFGVSFPDPVRVRLRMSGDQEPRIFAPASPPLPFVDFPVALPIRRQSAAGEAAMSYAVRVAFLPSAADLWDVISQRIPMFRRSPDWTEGLPPLKRIFRIVSQPTLDAQKSNPELDGEV